MAYKNRSKRLIHLAYEVLANRMTLSSEHTNRFFRIRKGDEGECQLDGHTDTLSCDALVLNDLQLEVNQSEFQTDTLILLPDRLLMLEVKNWEGDYIWGPEHFQINDSTFTSPLLQVQNTRAKLGVLTRKIGCPLPIEDQLVFINPNFTLWGAQKQDNILFHSRIPARMEQLNRTRGVLSDGHYRWAKELCKLHHKNYRDPKWPVYSYDELAKGLACPCCGSLQMVPVDYSVFCGTCGQKTKTTTAILKTIKDFELLFPEEKLTTARIRDWCGGIPHDSIYRVLKQHYIQTGTINQVYYLPK